MEAGELFESPAQHVAHGAHLALGQAGQRHQLGGDGEGVDAAGLARVEVGADAAALIVGMLFEQRVDLLPFDGDEARLAAAGEIADGLIGVARHHEGGVGVPSQSPSSRLLAAAGMTGAKLLACQPMASSRAWLVMCSPEPGLPRSTRLPSMSAGVLMLLLALASRVSDS